MPKPILYVAWSFQDFSKDNGPQWAVALLLWSGSAIFGVATQALNIAFDVDEKLGFVQRALIQLSMAVTIGLLLRNAFQVGSLHPW